MKILGKEYEIIETDPVVMHDKIGLVDYITNKIYISSVENKDTFKETLLHEIIHAVEYALGLGLNEQQVTALSSGLYSVAKENSFEMFELHYDQATDQVTEQE